MAASDHLGGQFTPVHRGVFFGDPSIHPKVAELADRVTADPRAALRAASKNTRFSSGHLRSDKGAVGIHWSTEQDVADKFGRGHWPENHVGVTLHGEAPHDSILHEGTPEHARIAPNTAVLGDSGGEHEVTMYPGRSVRLTGITVHHSGQSTYHELPKPKDVRA